MLYFVVALLNISDIKPIKVHIGDPIMNLDIESLDGQKTIRLEDVIETGFCIFLKTDCKHCNDGFDNIYFLSEDYPIIFIFPETTEKVKAFLERKGAPPGNAFLVEPQQLEPHDIVTFPSVIAYKDGSCRVAMHGPLNKKNTSRLLRIIRRPSNPK